MKNFRINTDRVSNSLIKAMADYKVKAGLTSSMTMSEAMNNPNLKTFDELSEREKYNITALGVSRLYKHLYNDECGCISANRDFKLSLWSDLGFDKATDKIVEYYSGRADIPKKYLVSDEENTQRNRNLEADIKALYPKIGYIKVNGIYQGSKEPSFLIYALQEGVNLLGVLKELGYKYEQDSVLYSKSNSTEGFLCFTTPLKYAFYQKKEGAEYLPYKRGQRVKVANHINIDQNVESPNSPKFLKNYSETFRKTIPFAFMRKSYRAVSIDNVTIKSIKAKLGGNHYHKVNGGQLGRVGRVVSRFNTKNPFSLDSVLKATEFDTNAGYCFIDDRDLMMQLENVSAELSNNIVTAIGQVENLSLIYALIKDVRYNSLNKHYSFIFDINNPLSDQSLNQLVVEVPLSALKGVKLNQIKNVLTAQIYNGTYQFRGDDYKNALQDTTI
ncbi:hypothetical protein [Helicobacter cetorum]|uniref:Uncharacterized protein n=1 Tax=Helicobacter cetorum (strain ATCC BAA-429 / MIT 00-7128) TaxID=182217 RepID=I0EKQ9_HELC0|nr:hypothetical protein HCW_01185 [Helicobacter cetorum MIT 00-7128]